MPMRGYPAPMLGHGKRMGRSPGTPRGGRTPIAALGTTDMHAQTQQHMEGGNIRVLTFVTATVDESQDIRLSNPFRGNSPASHLGGKKMSSLMAAALAANEEALARAGRPSCRIEMDGLNEKSLGALLLFFESSVAYEGELLNINAFDQPGVEAYKTRMKALLSDS